MAKRDNPAREALRELLNDNEDLGQLIYELTQVVVEKRNAADETKPKNKAECEYWQRAVVLMHEFQTELEQLDK